MVPSSRLSDDTTPVRHIDLCYDSQDSEQSALRLVHTLLPEWKESEGSIEFVKFTDGITNTLLKAIKRRPGYTDSQLDQEAVLLRAYGKDTDILIDRERESRAHSLLASRNLAPPLLARFDNGLLYKYIEGDVCSPEDLRRPEVYRAVAKRMGQWHSTLPISAISSAPSEKHASNGNTRNGDAGSKDTETARPVPNIWTVMQGWIDALPTGTEAEKKQKQELDEELAYITSKLANTPGMDGNDYVFSHCDLLSGNVIIEPSPESILADGDAKHEPSTTVGFIDYEYATPGHAAFDIANHFAEWAGFECDHGAVPSRSQRLEFVRHYIESYRSHAKTDLDPSPEEVVTFMHQIDIFRGVPGFYWGIWALIQATISSIDFDYKAYAPLRLGEYWGAKAEMDGSRKASGAEMTKREKRWAEE